MKIYISIKNIKAIDNLLQAIKVVAYSHQDIDFQIIITDDVKHTLSEDNNLSFIKEYLNDGPLFTFETKTDQNLVTFKVFSNNFGKDFYLGDFGNDSLIIEEKFQLVKSKIFNNKSFSYALLKSDDKFIQSHIGDKNFKGVLSVEDLFNSDVDIAFGDKFVCSFLISSFRSYEKFLTIKEQKKEEKKPFFNKVFAYFTKFNASKPITFSIDEIIRPYQICFDIGQLLMIYDDNLAYKDYVDMLELLISISKQ